MTAKDPLKDYRAKRNFGRTKEPQSGDAASTGDALAFVVQKHDARRLHYDLRLELAGVLKSWAVTRGPSLVPGEKRLAVQTEDHPREYLDFEGVIPKGEYGGGTMIVWDRGTWEPVGDAQKGLAKGHLEFHLAGQRLKGRWHLVRTRRRPRETREQWLLLKADDEHARSAGDDDLLQLQTSVVSGRTNEDLAQSGDLRADHAARENRRNGQKSQRTESSERGTRGRKALLPLFLEPSLANAVAQPPAGQDWIHEIKLDGYRIQSRLDGGQVRLLTRKGLDWTERFPTIASALARLPIGSALLDGEIVAQDGPVPSFSALQADLRTGRHDRLVYYLFDVLYLEGRDLTGVPQVERKDILARLCADVPAGVPVRYSEHAELDGPTMLVHACRMGLEGIVSKRKAAPYVPGRGSHWLKAKCVDRQEFIVVGYTPSTALKGAVGALALGYYDQGLLRYCGLCGSGFAAADPVELRKLLDPRRIADPPFRSPVPAGPLKAARWVEPAFVADVEFRGWTADGLLRQASFKGLRDDRLPADVVREATLDARPPSRRRAEPPSKFSLTHPDRVLWDEVGVTKLGLAEYYTSVAPWILPHIVKRPLNLLRCPSGAGQTCFYQRHAWKGLPPSVKLVDVGDVEAMTWIEDLDGLLGLVQANVLEIHPWGSRVDHLDRPDRVVFDLDPGEGVTWQTVTAAALELRQRLQDRGLFSVAKTTGGKGLHVVLPVTGSAQWEAAKAFSKSICDGMAKDSPSRYVVTASKAKRPGRIYLDYLRNTRGATAIAAYSTRNRPNASVSVPLTWAEVKEAAIGPDTFRVDNLVQRLDFLSQDPWAEFTRVRQRLPA
jgi:bifunctional non-homologous end joining protein LigD